MTESLPRRSIKRISRRRTRRTLDGSEAAALRELTCLYLKALENQQAKEDLLAVASHELRHPLHLMRMALSRHFPTGREAVCGDLERYIGRMFRLVDDLLDFVRIERNQLSVYRKWIDLESLLRRVT
jgi:signal transduction histidine kinase